MISSVVEEFFLSAAVGLDPASEGSIHKTFSQPCSLTVRLHGDHLDVYIKGGTSRFAYLVYFQLRRF